MSQARATALRALRVYVSVSIAVLAVTQLEPLPGVGRYVHLAVAAIFLVTAIGLTRDDAAHFGIALAGLLEPPKDDRPVGPLGLVDLGRAVIATVPSAIKELGVAVAIAVIVFPLYAVGYYFWTDPVGPFSLSLPPAIGSLALAQLVVVALPEEAFFRGYLQTALSDTEEKRVTVLGANLAPLAWLFQAVLFAATHFLVEPSPSRLAVFFPGLLFGWTRARRGGIGAAMALHAMSNLYSEILARSWL